MLRSRLLNNEEAYCLWVAFGIEIGIITLREIYGPYWPRKPLPGEVVYEWRKGDDLVAWTSIREDLLEPVLHALLGVFPKHQNTGHARMIFDLAIGEGFRLFPNSEWVFVDISKKNPRFFDYMKRQNCRWKQVGELLVPEPGYTIFGLEKEIYIQYRKADSNPGV